MVALVTCLIFVSAYGVGSVIAIGVILLPILLSIGMPRDMALSLFALSIGAPMYINVVLYNQMKAFFPKSIYGGKYLQFGICAMVVQMIVVLIFLFIHRKRIDPANAEKNLAIIGANDNADEIKQVSPITYIVPIIPVAMNMLFKWDAVPALIFGVLVAMLLTSQFKNYKHMVKFMNDTISQAISDIAGLVMFLMSLTFFSGAASIDAEKFRPIISAILPHSTLILCLAFGILSPLALFRGPLQVWGAGAATAAVLAGTGLFSDVFMLPLMYTATLFAISTDITQSWNVWGLDYMKVESKDFLKLGVPVMWIVCIINELLVYHFFG